MFYILVRHEKDGAFRILREEGFEPLGDLISWSRLGVALKVDLARFCKNQWRHVPSYGVGILDGGERKRDARTVDEAGTDEEGDSQDQKYVDYGSHVEKIEEPGVALSRKVKSLFVPGSRHFPFPGGVQ